MLNADRSFTVASATLQLVKKDPATQKPATIFSAAVYNVIIAPEAKKWLSIGSGYFDVPEFKIGGFALGSLHGQLVQLDNGEYEISATGNFKVPSLGKAIGCEGIGVGVTIYTTGSDTTMVALEPLTAAVAANYPAAVSGVALKEAELTLKCEIPIGTTGFYLTSVKGKVALGEGSTRVEVGVEVVAGKKIGNMAVASAKANAYVLVNPPTTPFEMGLSGAISIFAFQVGGASATLKPGEFKARLWVEAIVMRGNVEVRAWSDTGKFHLTGSAVLEVGVRTGSIYRGCVPLIPCCPGGKSKCWPWELRLCDSCIVVPWSDMILGRVGVEVGEFSAPGGSTAWGFKGWLEIGVPGFERVAFYIDHRGNLALGGNVERYKPLTSAQVAQARQEWAQARATGQADAAAFWSVDDRLGGGAQRRHHPAPAAGRGRPGHLRAHPPGRCPGAQPHHARRDRDRRQHDRHHPLPGGDDLHRRFRFAHGAAGRCGPVAIPCGWRGRPVADGLWLAGRYPSRLGTLPAVQPAFCDQVTADGQVETLHATSLPAAAAVAADTAQIRFVNSLPAAPVADLQVDGAPAIGGVAFGAASPYVAVPAGPRLLAVTTAGGAPVLASTAITLEAGLEYTALAAGLPGAEVLLVLADDNRETAAGQAHLRIVHAAPDAGLVDVSLVGHASAFTRLGFGDVWSYTPVGAGTYDVRVVPSEPRRLRLCWR